MALIKCEECGKQISDKAKTCVNCGCPIVAKKTKEVLEELNIDFSKESYDLLTSEEKNNFTLLLTREKCVPMGSLVLYIIFALMAMLSLFMIVMLLIQNDIFPFAWGSIFFISLILTIIFIRMYFSKIKMLYIDYKDKYTK